MVSLSNHEGRSRSPLVGESPLYKRKRRPGGNTRPALFPVFGVLCAPLYDYSAAMA